MIIYRQVLTSGEAAFLTDSSETLAQHVIGTINIVGKDLIAADVPAMQAFASHIAIALMNVRLLAALRDETKNRCRFSLGKHFDPRVVAEFLYIVN